MSNIIAWSHPIRGLADSGHAAAVDSTPKPPREHTSQSSPAACAQAEKLSDESKARMHGDEEVNDRPSLAAFACGPVG